MKYLDEYRDEKIAHALAQEIHERVTRTWVLMEICGGQTHTIMRYGIDELLPGEWNSFMGPDVQSASLRWKRSTRLLSLPRFRI